MKKTNWNIVEKAVNDKTRFLEELTSLCEKHGLVAVPATGDGPSAHDPMVIVPLDDFWRDYLRTRVLHEM